MPAKTTSGPSFIPLSGNTGRTRGNGKKGYRGELRGKIRLCRNRKFARIWPAVAGTVRLTTAVDRGTSRANTFAALGGSNSIGDRNATSKSLCARVGTD